MGDITSNLVRHYKLDDGSGTTATDSGSDAVNGTLTNMVGNEWSADAVIGGSLEFPGADDHVDLGTGIFNAQTNYTIAMWFKQPGGGSTRQMLFARYVDATSQLQNSVGWYNNVFRFDHSNVNGNTFQVNYAPWDLGTIDTAWHHVVCTFELGGDMKLYCDSVLRDSDSPSAMHIYAAEKSYLAKYAANYFIGLENEVRIYTRTLVQADVDDLFAWRDESATCGLAKAVAVCGGNMALGVNI